MGWEQRGPYGPYYIRRRTVKGQTIRQSYGSGPAAAHAAWEDECQREEEARQRTERHKLGRLDAEVQGLWQGIQILMQAHLLLAGYHQHHRGAWRRTRHDDRA